jgi:hypothetical protein
MGKDGSYRGVKRLKLKAEHSSPSGVEVKNAWSYMHIPVCFHWVVLFLRKRTTLYLTPCVRALNDKLLVGLLPLNKFPTFYGTHRFITFFTTACHLSMSRARSIQFTHPPPPTILSLEDPS